MRQIQRDFVIRTEGPGAVDITAEIQAWVTASGIRDGLLTLLVRHTSASLVVQENADPQVLRDLEAWLRRSAPRGDRLFGHVAEGPDDMPAHVRSAITSTTLSIPVRDREPHLGTWQAIYVWEHRDAPHERRVAACLIGD